MDWRDEGILLGLRRHGESSAIIEALTKNHGRHAGLVRGGAGKSRAAMLQPGALLALEWHARLADHLGTYKTELIRSHAAAIMGGRETLAALKDRKSTRLNSSHVAISYAVFCLKKKKRR